MSSEFAIEVRNLTKAYSVFSSPDDRLKQFVIPRLQKAIGREPKKYFKDFVALNDVSFNVRRGQTIGIVGRNGSGKSTLLQILCGTLTATSGQVIVKGRIAALLELGAGFNPEFSGRDNVYLNAALLGLSRAQTDARYQQICDFADIGDFIEQPVKTYSSGMLVRLAFAVIAHVDADVLVVDEALAVGDAFFNQKCMRFIRTFMKTGTVVFVTHDTGTVKSLCNYAIWLERGSLLMEGSPKEVCDQYLQAYFEQQQGKSTQTVLRPEYKRSGDDADFDQRLKYLNASNLRNDLKIMEFDPDAAGFGTRAATLVDIRLLDENHQGLSWIVGGEIITLEITAIASQPISSAIIGFYIKDSKGQFLFGENTFLSRRELDNSVAAGCTLAASFEFRMPILLKGDYSICAAIADGTQDDHVQLHWIHDGLIFRSESTSVAAGIIGIPMNTVKLKIDENKIISGSIHELDS